MTDTISVGGTMFDDEQPIDPAIITAAERIKRRTYEESNEGYDEWCRDCERIGHLGAELILQQQSGKPIPVVMSERQPARMIEDDEPVDTLSQPPTPQNLVDVLGWRITDGRSPDVESPISDAGDDGEIFITVCINSQHWMIAQDRDRIIIPTPSTLRDVVYLCRLLGIPCEVKR